MSIIIIIISVLGFMVGLQPGEALPPTVTIVVIVVIDGHGAGEL